MAQSNQLTDNAEIKKINEDFYRAFEQLDLDAMTEAWLHSNQSMCVHPGWDLIKGWDTIRRSWEMIFASTRYVEFDIEPLNVVTFSNVAQMVCYENLLTSTDGPAQRARILATNVFVRDPGGVWRLVHHHASQIQIQPPEFQVPR